MKKCTRCGKEYPDGVKSCAIDHHPLEPIRQSPEPSPESSAITAGGRPAAITFICVVGFISGVFSLLTVATLADQIRDPSYVPIMVLSSLAVIISMVGLFNMRRWG